MIPTRIHGVLDYALGILLIASPWLLDFHRTDAANWPPIALGGSAILYSLFTDYEAGVIKRLPMRAHLLLDAAAGLLLAAAPWLLGFAGEVWLPHVVFGALEVVVAALTRRRPSYALASRASAHAGGGIRHPG